MSIKQQICSVYLLITKINIIHHHNILVKMHTIDYNSTQVCISRRHFVLLTHAFHITGIKGIDFGAQNKYLKETVMLSAGVHQYYCASKWVFVLSAA